MLGRCTTPLVSGCIMKKLSAKSSVSLRIPERSGVTIFSGPEMSYAKGIVIARIPSSFSIDN